jgi:arsenite-transporting ATPase
VSRYRFFGGKGGVGKTTAASATALYLLNKLKQDNSILLFSTDPAHSLSDSLGVKVGNRLVKVAEHKGAKLIAYEMDAALALERFREAHGKVLAEIAERGTLLDEEDINELLNLSLPGLDEVMSLFELSELDRKGAYAHIVVDTAPSGHTSRLLRLPEVFTRMVHALDRMGEKHRYMIEHFARRRVVADEVDLFLQDLTARIQSVRKLLYDPEETSFTLVAIPEAMSVRETERYLKLLREQGVPVTDLIVNRVEQEHDGCVYCKARVATHRPWLKEIEKSFGDLRLHYVPLMAEEVRGLESLRKLGKLVWKEDAKRT